MNNNNNNYRNELKKIGKNKDTKRKAINNLEKIVKNAGEKYGYIVDTHKTRFLYGTVYVETFLIIKK